MDPLDPCDPIMLAIHDAADPANPASPVNPANHVESIGLSGGQVAILWLLGIAVTTFLVIGWTGVALTVFG